MRRYVGLEMVGNRVGVEKVGVAVVGLGRGASVGWSVGVRLTVYHFL